MTALAQAMRRRTPTDSGRKRWVGLITIASSGQLTAAGQLGADRRADFRHELRGASAAAWHGAGISAVRLAEAFLALGDGVCQCGDEGRREGLAVLLGALGGALDAIRTAENTALAQRAWNREAD